MKQEEVENNKLLPFMVNFLYLPLLTTAVCLTTVPQYSIASTDSISSPIFYDSFDQTFEVHWILSEENDYNGVWRHSKSEGHDDCGILVSEKARKYAIVKNLDEPVSLKDGTIILQFETRFQNGLECGGAYLKYLRPQEVAEWSPTEFSNESPYSIIGEYIEHHLKSPPPVPSDKLSHVYTAILKPDNEVSILVDGEEKKKGNFLLADDFEPSLIPSKSIPDPDDKKPLDWDERAKIPDLDATIPDDWDEDAPVEIEEKEAVKPEGWLDDEPKEINDPDAVKPEDWDDDEDGEWEAPLIDNPVCEAAPGCGEWKKPKKRNPAYKGKWHPPLIDNPNFKGIWKPREIPNPHYFELDKPNFEPIAAIGIEIWTMQDGILFDNILIASDEKVAESYRMTTWKPKYEAEKEKQRSEEELSGFQKVVFDLLYKIGDIRFLDAYKLQIVEFIDNGKKQPNVTIGTLVSSAVVTLAICYKILFGGKKPNVATKGGRTDSAAATNHGRTGEKGEEPEITNLPKLRL
ncbi:hypothetical protein MKX01_017240 [Papaver californicum]|nr:hypothetical protein MKX01_017240 [Papaver californicum]